MEHENGDAWRQYDTLVDIYKFYIDQLIKFHTFYFAIAGGVAVFALSNRVGAAPLVLMLPLVISTGGVGTFVFGIRKSRELTDEIKAIAKRLNMLSAHTEVLEFLCWAFLLVHMLIVGGLAWLLVRLEPTLTVPTATAFPGTITPRS